MSPTVVDTMATPGSPEHLKMITASKAPAIMGVSPFTTREQLWMEMSGHTIPRKLDADYLDWGHDIEDALVNHWKRNNPGWQTGPGEIAYTDEDLEFPNQATLDRRARRGRAFHRIECKSTAKTSDWLDDAGNPTVPLYVSIQDLVQGGISGIHDGSIVVMIYDGARHRVPVILPSVWAQPDAAEAWETVRGELEKFYASLCEATVPEPSKALIEVLHDALIPMADNTAVLDLPADNDEVVALQAASEKAHKARVELDEARRRVEDLGAGYRKITVCGKPLAHQVAGRFSEKRVPDSARHLLSDTRFFTTKEVFDTKAFTAAHPEIADIARGNPSWRFTVK